MLKSGEPKFSPAERAEIAERYANGQSATALGRAYVTTTHTVIAIVKAAGLHRPYAEARKLWSDQHDPPINEEIIADLLFRYANGESMHRIAHSLGWVGHVDRHSRLLKALTARGVVLRPQAEATSLATRNEDLAMISWDRWWELYWSPQSRYPSIESLAERFGVFRATIRRYLRKVGITPRTSGQQIALEFRFGRAKIPNPGGYGENWPAMVAANIGRKHPYRPRPAARRTVVACCEWCGEPIERTRYRMTERPGCTRSHAVSAAWWLRRFGPDTARPLIVERLIQAVSVTGKGARVTYADLERLGRDCGAREPDILTALEQMR